MPAGRKDSMFEIKVPDRNYDKNIVVLIDGDVIAYQAAYGKESVSSVQLDIKMQVERIQDDTNAMHRIIYLTGKENFRDAVAMLQQYKGNRYNPDGSRKKPQPVLLPEARAHLIDEFKAELQPYQEADDALTIAQTAFEHAYSSGGGIRSIISTIDKDLRICAGLHHNITSSLVDEVTRLGEIFLLKGKCKGSGLKFFYAQLLMGDSTDNIPGLPNVTEEMVVSHGCRRGGCGDTGAFKILQNCTTEYELFSTVFKCYKSYWSMLETDKHKLEAANWRDGSVITADPLTRLIEQGQLLWMRTYNEEMWIPPSNLLIRFVEEARDGKLDMG